MSSATTEIVWTDIHEHVQDKLVDLEKEVRAQLPMVQVDCGLTQGRQFYLFTHRTFSLPAGAIDSVVAGITFRADGDKVAVDADISGEETGDLIVSLPSKTVPLSSQGLLTAAEELAKAMCQSSKQITAALEDPSRQIE